MGRGGTDGREGIEEKGQEGILRQVQDEREAEVQDEREAEVQDEREAEVQDEREAEVQDEREAEVQDGREVEAQDEREAKVQDEREGVVEPVGFARDVLGVRLWSKQEEVLRAVMEERRVAVKSGNGLGKDFTAAVALLWYLHWSGMFMPEAGAASGPLVIGMDVARYGRNRTVIVVRRGDVVESVRALSGIDTMAGAGQVIAALREYGPAQVNVDEVGVGAGVVDRLREQGYTVRGMVGSRKPERDLTCANRRAEGYLMLKRRFGERRIRIPRDVELIKELAGLRYEYNSQGRMQIEGKRKMRRRGIASPDKADALMLAFLDDERDRFFGI